MSSSDIAASASVPFPVSLERRLGPIDAAAIVVSNVIGGGIFFVPILVAKEVPSGWALLGVWVFGGALAFAGAMAYAELATLRPHAGGEYVYLREAYGRVAAFLTGWTSFVAGFSGAIAASAVALAGYIGRFVPAAGNRTPLLSLPLPGLPLVLTPQALVAIAVIAALSLVHVHAIRPPGAQHAGRAQGLGARRLHRHRSHLGMGSFANVASTHGCRVRRPAGCWR